MRALTERSMPCAPRAGADPRPPTTPPRHRRPQRGARHAHHRLGLTLALKAAAPRSPALAGPTDGDRERDDGTEGATYRNDPRRGKVVRGGARKDHEGSLAQAHATLR